MHMLVMGKCFDFKFQACSVWANCNPNNLVNLQEFAMLQVIIFLFVYSTFSRYKTFLKHVDNVEM